MFKLPGWKREAKGERRKQQEESRGGKVAEDKGNTEQLLEQVNGLIEQRNVSSSASVRSILKAALSSAEQIVDSVKTRAVAEAQQEADRIIAEAKKKAAKIESQKKSVQKETGADTVSMAEQVAEELGVEPAPAPEKVVTEEAKLEPLESQVAEEAMSPPEEPAIVEPTAEVTEPGKAGKKRGAVTKEVPAVVLTKEESQAPYTGEVDINVEVPVEPTIVAKLYSFLQTTPEVKFVRTTGSWNKGSTITIVLEKPIPLLAVLVAKLPGANISPEVPEGKDDVPERRRVRRITISPQHQ